MTRALERHHKKEALVVPVILRDYNWGKHRLLIFKHFRKMESLSQNGGQKIPRGRMFRRVLKDWSKVSGRAGRYDTGARDWIPAFAGMTSSGACSELCAFFKLEMTG
jgi:hypothetical protein